MNDQRGFTLVELSIVLVILGLLVGGVLTGQSLIRAAELRSVTTQYQRYIAATMTFRDKYFALPGDMANAVSYWGAADGSTGNTTACFAAPSTTTATCNGDGNGSLVYTGTISNEVYRYWQHLANAGLIEGTYNGVTQGTNNASSTTANSPSGRINSSLWFIHDWGTLSGNSLLFDGVYGNTYEVGGAAANSTPSAFIFKAEEIYNIDVKLDDGKPTTGKVVPRGTFPNCTDGANSAALTAIYLLTNTTPACVLMFRQQF